MAFPNFPAKYGAEPLVTPQEHSDYRREQMEDDAAESPEAVILYYSRGLMDYLTKILDF